MANDPGNNKTIRKNKPLLTASISKNYLNNIYIYHYIGLEDRHQEWDSIFYPNTYHETRPVMDSKMGIYFELLIITGYNMTIKS